MNSKYVDVESQLVRTFEPLKENDEHSLLPIQRADGSGHQ